MCSCTSSNQFYCAEDASQIFWYSALTSFSSLLAFKGLNPHTCFLSDWCYQFECHCNHLTVVLLFVILYSALTCSQLWVFDFVAQKKSEAACTYNFHAIHYLGHIPLAWNGWCLTCCWGQVLREHMRVSFLPTYQFSIFDLGTIACCQLTIAKFLFPSKFQCSITWVWHYRTGFHQKERTMI